MFSPSSDIERTVYEMEEEWTVLRARLSLKGHNMKKGAKMAYPGGADLYGHGHVPLKHIAPP